MRGLAVRMAKRVNRVLFRRGRFWADRWHGRGLKSPREVRNALVYVINNRAKHLATYTTGPLRIERATASSIPCLLPNGSRASASRSRGYFEA